MNSKYPNLPVTDVTLKFRALRTAVNPYYKDGIVMNALMETEQAYDAERAALQPKDVPDYEAVAYQISNADNVVFISEDGGESIDSVLLNVAAILRAAFPTTAPRVDLPTTNEGWMQALCDATGRPDYTLINDMVAQSPAVPDTPRASGVEMPPIPKQMLDIAAKMGKIIWTAEALPDEEHVAGFKIQLEKTRKNFKLEGDQKLHGAQLENGGYQLFYTGTSPNSGNNAATIVGLWNWLVDQATRAAAVRQDGEVSTRQPAKEEGA